MEKFIELLIPLLLGFFWGDWYSRRSIRIENSARLKSGEIKTTPDIAEEISRQSNFGFQMIFQGIPVMPSGEEVRFVARVQVQED